MKATDPRQVAREYYDRCLAEFGATPRGVDWNSEASQRTRFDILTSRWPLDAGVSLLDYGCGYGALLDHLDQAGVDVEYRGFDVSVDMVAEARRRHPDSGTFTADESELKVADYAVASGVFNVRAHIDEETWAEYVLSTIDRLAGLGREGFAFNALTVWSDPEHRRDDLYYADPAGLLDYCGRRHSRWLTYRSDYGLYEFTIIVQREAWDG